MFKPHIKHQISLSRKFLSTLTTSDVDDDFLATPIDDDKKDYDKVIYVCADVSKMPKQHPEELHNLSVQNRLQSLEQRLKVVLV